MPSTLSWLHHDDAARDRTKRILALFSEQGTVDQLGLGSIRDSFADLLFPGTSTIQTRLRYFLFVPWIYSRLEQDEVDSRRIGASAREKEVALLTPLLTTDEWGVFGRTSRGSLKRLPSEVYWGGLGSWGIRNFRESRDQYHRAVDEVDERRRRAGRLSTESSERDPGVVTWHPELPPPPAGFPQEATLALTRTEAEFLRDRIAAEHRSSLLAWLALNPVRSDASFIWKHPLLEEMSDNHRHLLYHARLFSEVMNGAAVLYNAMLSEEAGLADLLGQYTEDFAGWADSLDRSEVATWSLDELFSIARQPGSHVISPLVEDFVRRWVAFVKENPADLLSRTESRSLIRQREMF